MAQPDPIAPIEILFQWEGPAILGAGVLREDRPAERLAEGNDDGELVAWLAVTAISGDQTHPARAAIRARAVGVLSAWRRRFGPGRIDDIKRQLIERMSKYRERRKISDEAMRERIEALFREVPS
jgi:hypothetical protein